MADRMMLALPGEGLWLGRVWRAGLGPSLVTLRAGRVIDVTSKAAPTMRDVLKQADIGALAEIAAASIEPGSGRADQHRAAGD